MSRGSIYGLGLLFVTFFLCRWYYFAPKRLVLPRVGKRPTWWNLGQLKQEFIARGPEMVAEGYAKVCVSRALIPRHIC